MNAAEQATSVEFASKIATAVRIFKSHFPDLSVDLKPWTPDQDTQALVDPDSIDLGFHFPGVSRLFKCRSLLMQIRFYPDPVEQSYRVIGIELAGFDHQGKQWTLSTIEQWEFVGLTRPEAAAGQQLKQCCQQVISLFDAYSNQEK
ncbi:MAG: hypothetical protein HC886_09190 [Leptolyngbyaceae cyanobacterium SM1_1_3]|nr:hypothetical protein [Leptolyngbyaceae cyanobacterium SM1_1_3]NJN02739.1 hypothetical protein [Leptolyngbyaceae cyanobacterium RM1_1_2]NJO09288.1 hypothetical protein [Leptolyngbyaceae cyanobacterium SL_1_1]